MSEPGATDKAVSLRSFLSDTAIFGMVDAASKFIGFVMLPITTFFLTPADFGVLGLFGTTSMILFIFCSLGLPTTFFRFYAENDDPDAKQKTVSVALLTVGFYCLITLTIVVLLGERLGEFLFQHTTANIVLAMIVFFSCVDSLGTCKLQADGKAWTFFWLSMVGIAIHRGLGLYWIFQGWGAWGWIYAELAAMGVVFILMFVFTFGRPRLQYDFETAREMIPYGATLVPVMISSWIMAGCDKYMIRALMEDPFVQIGLYSFGERISSIMQMIIQAFGLGWRRFAFQNMHLDDGPRLLGRGISLFFILSGFAALGISLLGDDLIHWLPIDSKYEPGAAVIPMLTMASFFYGLGEVAGIGFHKAKRTMNLAGYNVLAAIANILLNLIAIPWFGIVGAASATCICQGLKTGLIWRSAQRAFPIPVDYGHLVAAASVYAGTWAVGDILGKSAIGQWGPQAGWLIATAVQVLLVASVPPLLWITGAIRSSEKELILRYSSQMLGWLRRRDDGGIS
jgi:O-antigen/teichoic acid export membrane protein